jgi:transcriptional regulator with XRE-family HTH domain
MPEVKSEATKIFGARVREHRQRLGISQETLAQLSDLHWTFIGQVERGSRNLSLHNIVKIAGGLDVDPSVLVAGIPVSAVPTAEHPLSAADQIRIQRQSGSKPVA